MNDYNKMVMTDTEHQEREEKSNNTGSGKIMSKYSETEVGQNTGIS
jgi:hypothetical protein